MLNARLFQIPVSDDNTNIESAEQQTPPIDLDPQIQSPARYQELMNRHYATSTTGSR